MKEREKQDISMAEGVKRAGYHIDSGIAWFGFWVFLGLNVLGNSDNMLTKLLG